MKLSPVWQSIKDLFSENQQFSPEEFLSHTPIFKGISDKEIRKITPLIHYRAYNPEEYIFLKDQPGAAFYIIKKGALRVVQPDDPPIILAELGEGEIIGELAILDASPRSASAVTTELTELMAFFKGDIDDLMDREPKIAAKIYRNLAIIIGYRLKQTNEKLSS